jgi:ParB family chromosome partitioning protein
MSTAGGQPDPRRSFERVPLESISISSLNSRKNLDAGNEDAGLDELAGSIASNGLLQPPTLRRRGSGSFEVIAGQRRVLACRRLGWDEIDAFVVDRDDDLALATSLTENLQRADMHPLDKARGLAELSERLGSAIAAARAIGLTPATVQKYVSLLALPEDLRAHLGTADGPTGVGAMSALARSFTDADEAREAYELLHGFKSGTAEKILRRAEGDLDSLRDLREKALQGEFDIVRCGVDLLDCPWLRELPDRTRLAVRAALAPPN